MTSSAVSEPQRYLEAQIRWRPVEIAFWLATLLPFVLAPNYLVLASQIAITALFALSLDLILGYAGIVSLGHAAYFGFASYTAGLIAKWGWGEPLTGLVIAAAAAGLLGYLTSLVIARFRHLALIMITLGLGLLLAEAANSASWLTGGADGLQGVRMWKLFGVFQFDLYGTTAYTYSLVVLFLVFLVARRLINSPFGLALRGIRENAIRMPAIGAPSPAHIRKVYTIAATMAGIAGGFGIAALYRGLAVADAAVVAPTAAVVGVVLPVVIGAVTAGLPSPLKMLGMAAGTLGIWRVARGSSGAAHGPQQGLGLGLIAGLGFGGFFVCMAQVPHEAVFTPLVIAKAVAASFAVIVLAARRLNLPSPRANPLALAAGVLDAGGNVFYLVAAHMTRLDFAALVSSMAPAVTVVLAGAIGRQRVSAGQWLGVALCLAGVALIAA